MNNYFEIWSTPIGQFYSNNIVYDEVLKLLNDTTDDILYDDNNVFTSWVKSCCREYANNFYTNYDKVHIVSSYLSIQKYGEDFKPHCHQTADISAVYYVDAIDTHPSLELIDTRPGHKFNNVTAPASNNKISNDIRILEIKPENGKLVLFPGYVLHSVGTNLSHIPRYALSLNIVLE